MNANDAAALTRLLRAELTAVNQQFTHVLGLQAWGEQEVADRIMVVDYVDFPNAMRIADHLVRAGTPIALDPDASRPGATLPDILRVERVFEREIAALLDAAACHDAAARDLVARAAAPRPAYAAWLDDRIAAPIAAPIAAMTAPPEAARPFPETAVLYGHLLAVIEQSLLQAFVHWHADEQGRADAAWTSSGAAMIQGTALVARFSRRDSLPLPRAAPAPAVGADSDRALALDAALARQTARVAAEAALACGDPDMAALCRAIAAQFEAIAAWQPGQRHPAAGAVPPAFTNFESSLRKFVWD